MQTSIRPAGVLDSVIPGTGLNNGGHQVKRPAAARKRQTDKRPDRRAAELKDHRPAEPPRCSFLTQQLAPVIRFDHKDSLDDETFDRLTGSLKAYCRIENIPFPEVKAGSRIEALSQILQELNDEDPDSASTYINLLKEEDGSLRFIVQKDVTRYGTIFYMPIGKTFGRTKKFSEELGHILRRLMSTILKANRLDEMPDTRTFNYLEEMYEDNREAYGDEDTMESDAIKWYNEDVAGQALQELRKDLAENPFHRSELTDYTPEPFEEETWRLMLDGLEFIHPAKPITEYSGMFTEDQYNCVGPTIDDTIVLTYSKNGITEEFYMDMMNNEADSGCMQMMLLDECELSPDMTELSFDGYPERFMTFIDKLTNLLDEL